MKKLLLGTALAVSSLAVLMPVQNAMAQNADNIANVATVGSVGKGINWLAKRIFTLDIGTQAYEMQRDGVSAREYVAVFTMRGALIHNYEFNGSEGVEKVGIEPGAQLLPYTVSITPDGRKLISIGAFSFRQMTKAFNKVEADYGKYDGDGWTVVNNMDFLVYEYDDSFGMNNTKVESFDLIRAEAKVDILGAAKPGHFLAVVAGGALGFEKQTITHGDDIFGLSELDGDDDKLGFRAKYKVGLEYNLPMGKAGNLNTSLMLNGSRLAGYNFSQADYNQIQKLNKEGQLEADTANEVNQTAYSQQVGEYNTTKASYEATHLDGVSISDDSYTSLTGINKPSKPATVKYDKTYYDAPEAARTYMYLSPSLKYSKGIGKGATTLELNVFGNIPLRDDLKTKGVELDLSGTNAKPLFGAGIKVQF